MYVHMPTYDLYTNHAKKTQGQAGRLFTCRKTIFYEHHNMLKWDRAGLVSRSTHVALGPLRAWHPLDLAA